MAAGQVGVCQRYVALHQQVFNRLKARTGIPGRCSPHTLRHTFARSYRDRRGLELACAGWRGMAGNLRSGMPGRPATETSAGW